MRKQISSLLSLLALVAFTSCSGEDRSSEQPLVPTLHTLSTTVKADSCTLQGQVMSSPNSTITHCGFKYGTIGTAGHTLASTDTTAVFIATTPSLKAGTYFGVAFATNGVGTSYGDTLHFTIETQE
ncbi:MAG: hypothetical protein RR386_01690 [Bacteroidaceae bacterium]